MIKYATVRRGDMISNPGYPKAHFRLAMVIDQKPDDFLNEVEFGDFQVLTDTGMREWYTFDYVYCRCELLNREDRKDPDGIQ